MKNEENLSKSTKRKKAIQLLAITALTLLLIGASCSIKHNYPIWPVPERPRINFFPCRSAEPEPADPVYCVFRSDLSLLNIYVEELLMTIESYESEIRIINY